MADLGGERPEVLGGSQRRGERMVASRSLWALCGVVRTSPCVRAAGDLVPSSADSIQRWYARPLLHVVQP